MLVDHAPLNTTKLRVVKIMAKSMKFAAGVLDLDMIAQNNTLCQLVLEYKGMYPHDELFHESMTQNLSGLLNSQSQLKRLRVDTGSCDNVLQLPQTFALTFELKELSISQNISRVDLPEEGEVPGVALPMHKLLRACHNSCTTLQVAIKKEFLSEFGTSLMQTTGLKTLKFESESTPESDKVFKDSLQSKAIFKLKKLEVGGYMTKSESLSAFLRLQKDSLGELRFSSIIPCRCPVWSLMSRKLKKLIVKHQLSKTSLQKFKDCSIEDIGRVFYSSHS